MSLRLRLALSSSLLTLAALVLLAVLGGVALRGSLQTDLDEELQVQTQVVLDSLRLEGSINQTATDALTTPRGSSAVWVYQNGRLLEGAGLLDAPEPLDAGFLQQSTAAAKRTVEDWRVSSLRLGEFVVQVGRPTENIERTFESYVENTLLYGFIAAILAGVVTALLVARSTAPLVQLAHRASQNNDHLPTPHITLRDEVGMLARSLEQGRLIRNQTREHEARFLADAAHELRTPVSAMLAMLEVRLSQPADPSADRSTLQKTAQHAKHLRDLAQNLLALTRAERSLSVQALDLLELAGNAVDLLAPLAAQKNLEISCDGSSAPLRGDPILLARAFENLIANSIKFTDHGEIVVTVGQTWLEVRDTGIGIAPEMQKQILLPFHRDGHRDGSGLGLAVVQAVTEAHGGRLQLQSTLGQGTCVRLEFA